MSTKHFPNQSVGNWNAAFRQGLPKIQSGIVFSFFGQVREEWSDATLETETADQCVADLDACLGSLTQGSTRQIDTGMIIAHDGRHNWSRQKASKITCNQSGERVWLQKVDLTVGQSTRRTGIERDRGNGNLFCWDVRDSRQGEQKPKSFRRQLQPF